MGSTVKVATALVVAANAETSEQVLIEESDTVDITVYGDFGPYRHRRAYDLLVQAESCIASITGTPDAPGRIGKAGKRNRVRRGQEALAPLQALHVSLAGSTSPTHDPKPPSEQSSVPALHGPTPSVPAGPE